MNEIIIPSASPGMEIRVTRLAVGPEKKALFDYEVMTVEIDDEAAGEYVVVSQCTDSTANYNERIAFNPEEWPALRMAIDFMVSQCRNYE